MGSEMCIRDSLDTDYVLSIEEVAERYAHAMFGATFQERIFRHDDGSVVSDPASLTREGKAG